MRTISPPKNDEAEPIILKMPEVYRSQNTEYWRGVLSGLVLAKNENFNPDAIDRMIAEAERNLGHKP